MTFEERFTALLVEHGMFESQAQTIIDRMKADKNNEAMDTHWGRQVTPPKCWPFCGCL